MMPSLLDTVVLFVLLHFSSSVESVSRSTTSSHHVRRTGRRTKSTSKSKSSKSISTSKSVKGSSGMSSNDSSTLTRTISPSITPVSPAPTHVQPLTTEPVTRLVSCGNVGEDYAIDATAETSVLYYSYSIEVNTEITNALDAIDIVKTSIFQDLVNEFNCSNVRSTRHLKKKLRSGSHSSTQITGFDSRPDDIILGDECGLSLDEEFGACYVVSGSLSISFHNQAQFDWIDTSSKILRLLKTHMNRGDYNDVDQGIVRVTYISVPTSTQADHKSSITEKNNTSSQHTDHIGAITIIVASCAVIIAILIIFQRRRNFNDNNGKDERIDEATVHSDNVCPPVIVETVVDSKVGHEISRHEIVSFEPYPSTEDQARRQFQRLKTRRKRQLTTIEELPNESDDFNMSSKTYPTSLQRPNHVHLMEYREEVDDDQYSEPSI